MDKIDDEIKLGEGSLNLADTNGAIRHFEKAKGMLPTSSSDRDKEYSAAKLGEMALALFDASQNATTDPADAEKQEAKAAEYAQDSIAKSSHEGASHYVLGMRAFHKRNYDTAEKELKLAIQEDTGNFMYYYQLGRVQATESKYSDARISFTSAIKYNGNYAPAQYNLGFVQEKLNRDEALASYRKAYSIDSNYERLSCRGANTCPQRKLFRRTHEYKKRFASILEMQIHIKSKVPLMLRPEIIGSRVVLPQGTDTFEAWRR